MSLAEAFESSGGGAFDLDAPVDPELVFELSRQIEADRRRLDAQQAALMAAIDRCALFSADGHRDARGWFRATHRWASGEATDMRRLSRLGVAAPVVLDELADGVLGRFQANVLARAFANPRVADQLLEMLGQLLEHAKHLSALEFQQLVEGWVRLVDADGAFDARERAAEDRAMTLGGTDETFVLRLLGPAIDGELLRTRLQRFLDAEWKLDWARCVAEHGDDACPALMARTATQRRYDAFMRMLLQPASPVDVTDAEPDQQPATEQEPATEAADVAASDEPDDSDELTDAAPPASPTCTCGGRPPGRPPGRRAGPPESLTYLMIDIATFEAAMFRLLGPPPNPVSGVPPGGLLLGDGRPIPRPDDLRRWCSQTTDGRYVPPEDIALEALFGRVRTVITDERGVVLHMGHSKRLFVGALREAIILSATRCTHPGCLAPASQCQADHLEAHSQGGVTDVGNGGPRCWPHNWWRFVTGATSTLDPNGYWHTFRSDGTEIG